MKKGITLLTLLKFIFITLFLISCNKTSKNAENYKIAFIRKANLWIMNEDGTNQKQITNSNKVIALTTKSNIVYYSEIDGNNLKINKLNIKDNYKTEFVISIKSKKKDNFIDNLGKGEMGWVEGKYLGVSANTECPELCGFMDGYAIDLQSNNIYYCSNGENTRTENVFAIKLNRNIEFKFANEETTPFYTEKVNNEYELFYKKVNNEMVKISSTQQISPRKCYDSDLNSISYLETSSGKVLFYIKKECYEECLYSAELFIVNKDGTSQKSIGSFFEYYKNYAFLKSNEDFVILNDKNVLVKYTGSDNQPVVIANDVDYFELVDKL